MSYSPKSEDNSPPNSMRRGVSAAGRGQTEEVGKRGTEGECRRAEGSNTEGDADFVLSNIVSPRSPQRPARLGGRTNANTEPRVRMCTPAATGAVPH